MKTARNILFISIIAGLTVPQNVFLLAVHLSDFIHHFHEHKAEHGHISFIDFIAEHSTTTNHEHKDNHAHDNLPINNPQSPDSNQSLTYIAFNHKGAFEFYFPVSVHNKISSRQFFQNSEFVRSIWQPPKIS